MAFNKDQFIEDLKTMSVLELNDLVKAIEEEFGVSAAAPVAVAAAGGAEEAADAKKTVILAAVGGSKMGVIKAIRAINSDLTLAEAKDMAVDGTEIKANVDADEADSIKEKLEEAGATVELK